MRRFLPAFFCVAAATGPLACDQAPTEPVDIDFRAAGGIPGPPDYAGNGDIQVFTRAADDDGGGDILVFDIVDSAIRNRYGDTMVTVEGSELRDNEGAVVCTHVDNGPFGELRDANGVVLYSTLGPWIFDGAPEIAGMGPEEANGVLANALRFSIDGDSVIEGVPGTGEEVAYASEEIQFATSLRRVIVTAMLDGACGSEGIEVDLQ